MDHENTAMDINSVHGQQKTAHIERSTWAEKQYE
jgi:hypothetical protein